MADIKDTPLMTTRRWVRGVQSWQAVLTVGLLGLAVLAASTTTVVLQASDPASADTFISVVREAEVYLPDGSDHPATEGERLSQGARLQTGRQGGAQLTTAGRTVYVGALSTLRILNGVHQGLDKGLVMVDARNGARLAMDTSAGTIQSSDGSLTRVEQLPAFLRVAVYAGHATITAAGRSAQTAVPGLYQVQVNYGALPGAVTPLALRRGDPWDMTLVSDLYSNDTALLTLADSLGGAAGSRVYAAAPASLRIGAVTAPGGGRAQDALSLLIAQASTLDKAPADILDMVRTDYAEGGSWGVIAALVQARVNAVSALLSAALSPPLVPGQTTPTTTTNAGQQPGNLIRPRLTPSPSPGPSPTPSATPQASSTPAPTRKPVSSHPSPSPTATPGLVTSLVDTLIGVLQPKSPVGTPATPRPAHGQAPCVLGLIC